MGMLRWWSLVVMLLVAGPSGRAQTVLPDTAAPIPTAIPVGPTPSALLVHRDPPAPQLRTFQASALEELKADPDNHWEVKKERGPTWWESFLAWLQERLRDTLGTAPASWVMRNLWVIIIIAAVLFAAFTLRRRLFTGAFRGAPARLAKVSTLQEEVEAEDLDARIAEAEREGAWRRALRLHYLSALRRLSERGHITLKPDATDRDYLLQVQDRSVRNTLDKLAFTFQWVWYGEADVDRGRYELLIGDFRRFDPPVRP